MQDLTLWCFPFTSARATLFALEQAGVNYRTRLFDIMKGEQFTTEFLPVNPKGQIPVLIVDGQPLTESAAILGFLAQSFPQAGLAPEDPFGRAQALSVVSWLASGPLTALLRVVRPYRISDDPGAAMGIRSLALTSIHESLALADRHLAGREWWLDQWSVADAYLYYMVVDAARFDVDFKGFASLDAFRARSEQRPAIRRVIEWEEKTLAALPGGRRG